MRDVKQRINDFKEYYQIYSEEEMIEEAKLCLACDNPFCSGFGCPLSIDIPLFLLELSHGRFLEAYHCLCKDNPFPEWSARLCHKCQASCIKGVKICSLIISLMDLAFKEDFVEIKKGSRTLKKVAIIGSGIAGLTCAYALNRKGYIVDVYDCEDRYGGKLIYDIPNYILDKDLVYKRISLLMEEGINFYNNQNILSFGEIENEHDFVILAIGALEPKKLTVTGSNFKSVIYAHDYLKKNNKSLLDRGIPDNLANGKTVLVIGAGKTGMYCLSTALRQHAKLVGVIDYKEMLPLRRTNFFPEESNALDFPDAVLEARALTGLDPRSYNCTLSMIAGDYDVKQVRIEQIKWEESEGVLLPVIVSGESNVFSVDLVIVAMGYLGVSNSLLDALGLERTNRCLAVRNYQTLRTKVYACGEAVLGSTDFSSIINDALSCVKVIDEKWRNK